LLGGEFGSVEELASSVNLHPKVVRSEIRLAFLAPEITDFVLTAGCSFGLADLRKISALSWQKNSWTNYIKRAVLDSLLNPVAQVVL